MRGASLDAFSRRLFKALDNPTAFNPVLERVLGFPPEWTIDLSSTGQHYLKFVSGEYTHDSDGLGEGIVSLFFIVDALYDAQDGALIAIDEPELSLHPAYQRRLMRLLREYSATRQIVYATHSPYFVDFDDVASGARVVRLATVDRGECKAFALSTEVGAKVARLLCNRNNPHVLGLDAREAFFLSEGIVLLEGQEDRVHYPLLAKQLGCTDDWNYFGWGVGGAGNMELIAHILHDLGFRKVAGVLDGNMTGERDRLQELFPDYCFACIPADDVRTKKPRPARTGVEGLLDKADALRSQYEEETRKMMDKLTKFFGKSG